MNLANLWDWLLSYFWGWYLIFPWGTPAWKDSEEACRGQKCWNSDLMILEGKWMMAQEPSPHGMKWAGDRGWLGTRQSHFVSKGTYIQEAENRADSGFLSSVSQSRALECSHSRWALISAVSSGTLMSSCPTNPREDEVSNVWTGLECRLRLAGKRSGGLVLSCLPWVLASTEMKV